MRECRRKESYALLRKHPGEVVQETPAQNESRIEAGHLTLDHVRMLIGIPPEYAISQVAAYITGESAIHRSARIA